MISVSPRRDSAPGRVMMAQREVQSTGSSTNTESGKRSSGGSRVMSTSQVCKARM